MASWAIYLLYLTILSLAIEGHQIDQGETDDDSRVRRVSGGNEVVPNSFPWVGAVYFNVDGGGIFICSCILVEDAWVLTAAHCVDGVSPRRLRVVFGEHDLAQPDGTEQSRSVADVIVHSDYVEVTSKNDLAFLKLKKRLRLNQYIDTIPLGNNFKESGDCVVTGWGRQEAYGPLSTVLRAATVDVMTNADCQAIWGQVNKEIFDSVLCAGTGLSGTCYGDSGGPLMCLDNNVWTLHGITSFGTECGFEGVPELYTRISSFYDLITETIAGGPGNGGGNGGGNGRGKGKRANKV